MPAMRRGVSENLTPSPLTSISNGNGYSLPVEGTGARIAWQVNVAGGPPTALTVQLQGTLDGVNWFMIDQSTSLNGELRIVAALAVSQIRAAITALTGAATVTVFARTQ